MGLELAATSNLHLTVRQKKGHHSLQDGFMVLDTRRLQ